MVYSSCLLSCCEGWLYVHTSQSLFQPSLRMLRPPCGYICVLNQAPDSSNLYNHELIFLVSPMDFQSLSLGWGCTPNSRYGQAVFLSSTVLCSGVGICRENGVTTARILTWMLTHTCTHCTSPVLSHAYMTT